jgi:hypothetical protein
MIDLGPPTMVLAALVRGVRDDHLGAPTACAEANLADLLDRGDGLALAFTAVTGVVALDEAVVHG